MKWGLEALVSFVLIMKGMHVQHSIDVQKLTVYTHYTFLVWWWTGGLPGLNTVQIGFNVYSSITGATSVIAPAALQRKYTLVSVCMHCPADHKAKY